MTQEEKARAYDEALEKAREHINSKGIGDTVDLCKHLFSELRESEDERIRKELIFFLKEEIPQCSIKEHAEKLKEFVSYLEKQKEQNGEDEECTDFTIYHPLKNGKGEYKCIPYSFYGSLTSFSEDKDLIDFLRTCFYTEEECKAWIEKQKEQKPISAAEVLAKAGLKPYKDGNQWCILAGNNIQEGICGFGDTIDEALYQFLMEVLEKQKEQKPTDKIDLKFNIGDTIVNKKNGEKCTIFNRCLLHQYYSDTNHCHEIKFDEQDDWELVKEQKPAEWSEVELEFRGEKVTVKRPFFRDDKGRGYSTTKQDEEVAWNALRAWCEKKGISLYDLYPKAEWSEEDADILNCCISSIEEAKENRYAYKETDGDTSYDREINWLKSLRPSWKPSEEQMNVLRKLFIEGIKALTQTDCNTLNSIYLDLKKLI